ncbi:DNA-3-methyladenine glycosylase I [Sporolactobacillus sp. STCC-11]|uniref:DNA-3-methyladenine glycosylase I n=1 Tax=Sporolactobacillus caesalpiniae TaxID=3230362 RepID=UPI0033980230
MESTCSWAKTNELMRLYHDTEWCRPNHDDRYIFELLVLEGAQAGLSWSIVLNKREEYRKAFNNFDIQYCANLTDQDIDHILLNTGVVNYKLKINSVRSNALAAIAVQREFGSLSNYLWTYVDHQPIISNWRNENQVPSQTDLSKKISKDLKKKGFKFVGPVTIYSFMQAIGMVDDHVASCSCHTKNRFCN